MISEMHELYCSEEHQLLHDVQERLGVHPLTAPVLGNNHAEFRHRGIPVGSILNSCAEFHRLRIKVHFPD
jgi:hypothetical protein